MGDVVFACAMPGDPLRWATRQLEAGGDAINVVCPVAEEMIFIFPGMTGSEPDRPALSTEAFSETTTLAEIVLASAEGRRQLIEI